MGHGLNNAVQDVLVRWRRMAQDEALWVPGTDHAGIATQNVVERIIAKEGSSRFDLGRAAFLERVTEFVAETGGIILEQLRAIGSSCDWSRTAYTFSPQLSRAVREAFVRLYEEGLVYRGHRVIHWCPRCLTSLSDEEAEPRETHGKLYYVSYAAANGSGQLDHCRHHASRNDSGRRCGRRESGRRSLSGSRRHDGDASARRHPDSGDRR